MNNILDNLKIIVPFISIIVLLILTSIHIFYRIRRLFSIKVNCWFCNQNAIVPYDQSNSWICPYCEQYNGFDENGDYNREIPQQKYSKLNSSSKNCSFTNRIYHKKLNTNGLCEFCNHNQELKIQQLASFVPENEFDYDEEIEEYRKQLERSYQLCQKCQKVVKRTLNKVKSNILGSKLRQIGSKGLSIIDNHMRRIQITASKERIYFSLICFYTLTLFSVINLFKIIQTIDLSKHRLEQLFSQNITFGILVLASYITAFKQTVISTISYALNYPLTEAALNFFNYLSTKIYVERFLITEDETKIINNNDIVMNVVGVIMSICLFLVQTDKKFKNFVILLMWNIGQCLFDFKELSEYLNNFILYDVFMITFMIMMFSVLCLNFNGKNNSNSKKMHSLDGSFHRIYTENQSDLSDDSDSEEDLSSHRIYSSSPKTFKRVSPLSLHNTSCLSLNSTKSTSPTTYLPNSSVFHNINNKSSTSVYNGSFYSCKSKNRNDTMTQQVSNLNRSFAKDYSAYDHNLDSSSFYTAHPLDNTNNINNSRIGYSLKKNCVDSLNLDSINLGSNHSLNMEFMKNPFSSHPERSPSSCSVRSSVRLAPSRLHFNNYSSAASQSSWVAGGYWGASTSPQKQFIPPPLTSPISVNSFSPIVASRTSSQSSGFESKSSSTNLENGQSAERNSRESSMYDEIERTSMFSEPNSYLSKNNKTFNTNNYNHQNGVRNRIKENSNNHINNTRPLISNNSNAFCFKSLSNDIPHIPKGKLLKNWIDKNNPVSNL